MRPHKHCSPAAAQAADVYAPAAPTNRGGKDAGVDVAAFDFVAFVAFVAFAAVTTGHAAAPAPIQARSVAFKGSSLGAANNVIIATVGDAGCKMAAVGKPVDGSIKSSTSTCPVVASCASKLINHPDHLAVAGGAPADVAAVVVDEEEEEEEA